MTPPSARAFIPKQNKTLKLILRALLVTLLVGGIALGLYWVISWTYPFRWPRALEFLPEFNKALLMTIQVSLVGMGIGLALGLLIALARLSLQNYQPTPLPKYAPFWKYAFSYLTRVLVTLAHDLSLLYVHTIRSIPFLVFILFMYFGVGRAVIAPGQTPSLFGVLIDERFLWGSIALGLFEASFVSEIFRAGIQAVHKTQMEAARSLGMGYRQSMQHVILPQAFRNIIPPMTGEMIALVKESALLTIISLGELTHRAQELGSRTLLQFEFFLILAGYYLLLTIPLGLISYILERRLNIHRRRA